jgi:SAM-dependent methyltransferase
VERGTVTSDPTRRFSDRVVSDRVEYYIRARPEYPSTLLKFCQENLGLRSSHLIADIGSGTGILTKLFLQNGNRVFAVEPNAEMRGAAEQTLSEFQNFVSRAGIAENTGLEEAGVDFVVAGQAFHWFDRVASRKEFARILRPEGWVVLVWNDRKVEADSFSAVYERIIQKYAIDLGRVKHQNITATEGKELEIFFTPGSYSTATFKNVQDLDLSGVIARALSSSYLPLPGQPRCEEMLDELRYEFEEYQQNKLVQQLYETKIYYGRLAAK